MSTSPSRKPRSRPQSSRMTPGRALKNPGVESPQRKGDSRCRTRRPRRTRTLPRRTSTVSVTRSPSWRCTSTRPPRGCSISSASSTRAGAGATAFARAPTGSPGGSGSRRVRPESTCGWRGRSARCRSSRGRWLAEHVERIVRGWRRVDRKAEAREAARQHAGRALHVYQDEDGMVRIRGRLTPEIGALLMKALDAAGETLYQRRREQAPDDDPPTMERQRADALALLAETALHHDLDPGGPGERYQVVVHVDAAVLADPDQDGQSVLEDGLRVPAGTSRRLACDASRVVMRHDADGRLLEVGARTRTIPPALRRALHHAALAGRATGRGLRDRRAPSPGEIDVPAGSRS